jgi:hypothetical protein
MTAFETSSPIEVRRTPVRFAARWRWWTTTTQRWALFVGVVGILVAAKAVTPDEDWGTWVRQATLVAALTVVVFLALGRPKVRQLARWTGLVPLSWFTAGPDRAVAPPSARRRAGLAARLGLGLGGAAVAVATAGADDRTTQIWGLVVAGACLSLLAGAEFVRYARWRWPQQADVVDRGGEAVEDGEDKHAASVVVEVRERPRRRILWAVAPLVLVALAAVLSLVVDREPSALSDQELAELLVVTAFGEELVFRGLLLVLAYRLFDRVPAEVATAVAFGLWHVPDALADGGGSGVGVQIAVVAAQVVATSAAGIGFSWLRHRTESLAGPVGAHVATNLPGLVLLS